MKRHASSCMMGVDCDCDAGVAETVYAEQEPTFRTFTVPGRPIAQPRTRSTRWGRHYTPNNGVLGFKAHAAMLAKQAGCTPLRGIVAMELHFLFKRPQSHFTTKGALKAKAPQFPGHNCGDTDNLTKAIKDALSGIAFVDDTQVCEEHVFKRWADEDCTIVRIW